MDEKSAEGGRYLIVHNIGQGPRREDVLFAWKITGHYQLLRTRILSGRKSLKRLRAA